MSVWTPSQQRNHEELADIERFFAPISHAEVLKFSCGLNRNIYPNAPPLIAYTVVICLDTGGWDTDSQRLKEIEMSNYRQERSRGTYDL